MGEKYSAMNRKLPRRKRLRLKGYDYSSEGVYFVTICAQNRQCLFGKIKGGRRGAARCALNKQGKIVYEEWINTKRLRNNISLDEYVIMPNHFHGTLIINKPGTARRAPTDKFGQSVAGSLSTIIRAFKSMVTKRINEFCNAPGTKLWQRNYYEHIIRNERDLARIREYITSNPANWEKDEYNIK